MSFPYQPIGQDGENGVPSSFKASTNDRWRRIRAVLAVMTVLGVLALFPFLLPLSKTLLDRRKYYPLMQQAPSPYYCRTSCADPCATHSSVYGELCCDYAVTPEGKVCGLIVRNGVCTCLRDPSSLPFTPP